MARVIRAIGGLLCCAIIGAGGLTASASSTESETAAPTGWQLGLASQAAASSEATEATEATATRLSNWTARLRTVTEASAASRAKQLAKHRTYNRLADQLDGFHLTRLPFPKLQTARLAAWAELIDTYADANFAPVAISLPDGLRVISEVRVPTDAPAQTELLERLDFYRESGYTGVHLVIREDDDPSLAALLAAVLADAGWTIIVAFGPDERHQTAYADPSTLRSLFAAVLPHASLLLPGWRGTSNPHWHGDPLPYINALIGIARDIRADIPVAGEFLFEHTTGEFRKLSPSAASAVIVLNVGMRRLNLSAVHTLIRQDTALPLIGMTVGPVVYWSRTTWNAKRKEVWNIKQQIETRFLKSGFVATLTLVGDGADGHFGIAGAVNTVDWQAILADDTTSKTQ